MDIFEKNISVKGILGKLLSLSNPIIEGLRLKNEEENELHKSLVPGLIRIKND
ncbi:hypothetical protein [Flagellimonas oceanensis]|uniref:hypothetical protein n=1 Tax=Flagellimonas oceanensis TaxID=2499163 RepID=UPI0013DF77EE|nr:hypothetical protein [Allomuricauda oceanensis]